MSEYTIIIRLIIATVIGGLIGMEREAQNQPAGLRTHILVCVGSSLIMMVSLSVYYMTGDGDPARIASQVISGMGFLGAGTIMVRGFDIKGLTTAASLWVNAGIGLAVGLGFYVGAISASLIVLVSLFFLGKLENSLLHKSFRELTLYTYDEKIIFSQMTNIVSNLNIRIKSVRVETKSKDDDALVVLHYEIFMPFDLKEEIFFKEVEKMNSLESAFYDKKLIIKRDKE